MDFQDNLKTVFTKPSDLIEGDSVVFKVGVIPNCDPVFYTDVVEWKGTDEQLAIDINDKYCEWYRSGGVNVVREYFEKENN